MCSYQKNCYAKKKESGSRGRKQQEEMARKISEQGHWMKKIIKKTNSRVGLLKNDSAAIVDADQSTNISADNEVVYVIMNKLIDKDCDEIESNSVEMDNMNNKK